MPGKKVAKVASSETYRDDELEEDYYAPVTPELLEKLMQQSRKEVLLLPLVQLAVMFVTALICALIGDLKAGLFALLGAACYVLPNTLLATRLFFNVLRKKTNPTLIFVGEFIKLLATISLLVVVIKLGAGNVVWPALLAGLFLSLKSYLFLLFYQSSKVT